MRIVGISLALVAGLCAWGQEEAVPLGIIVEPPTGEFTVRIWVEKPVYSVGEQVRIFFELNKQAYVYIWDIMPDRRVHQIFPNHYEPQNHFPAGVHSIPSPERGYQFTVTPPVGMEWLQIMATTVPIPYFQRYGPSEPFPLLSPDPQSWQDQLEAQILGIVPEPTQRAFDFTSFEVVFGPAPGYGALQVTTTPPLAALYVDGIFRGFTPKRLTVTAGSHRVLIRKSGYQDHYTTVYILPGGTRTVNVNLTPVVTNKPPVARFIFAPTSPRVDDWVYFDASASSDPDGTIANYMWDFEGDGVFDATGKIAFFRYVSPGTYTVRLVVTDDQGAKNTTTQTIVVRPLVTNQPPVARFTFTPVSPGVGDWIQFDASLSHDPDGTIASYQWDFQNDGTFEMSGQIVFFRYDAPGTYTVRLVVSDEQGAVSSTTQTVLVRAFVVPGMPPMLGIPGIYVWGLDRWYITVNGVPSWISPHAFFIELRTDGEFIGFVEEAGPAPLGLVPEPTSSGWRVVREGTVSTGSVTYSFAVRDASTIFFNLRLDMDGDGSLESAPTLVRLRQRMVSPPSNPFVVGLPEGYSGDFLPRIDFRIGRALAYTENVRIIFWQTTISALEGS